MRLLAPLVLLALLMGGCMSGQQTPVPTSAATATLAPAPTATPQPTRAPETTPSPTAGVADGGPISPCELSLIRPRDDRQQTFLQWSLDGSSLIFDSDGTYGNDAIWQVGTDGSYARRIAAPLPDFNSHSFRGFHANLSPDGRRLVYSTCEYKIDPETDPETAGLRIYELAVIGVDGGEPERLTEGTGAVHYPVWHPDGSRIAYVGAHSSGHMHYTSLHDSVWVMSVDHDGSGPRTRRVHRIPGPAPRAPVWSPDGEHIAAVAAEELVPIGWAWRVYVAQVGDDSHLTSQVVPSKYGFMLGETTISPSWSPDGTRLVFAENNLPDADGVQTSTIRIVNRDGTGAVELPETGGHISHVAWHPDGSEILVAGTAGLWTISPDGEVLRDVFRPDDDNPRLGWGSSGIAWSPDGSRFAVRDGTSFVLATASREGDDWRILVPYGGDGRVAAICIVPTQSLRYPSGEDLEEHCEQSP